MTDLQALPRTSVGTGQAEFRHELKYLVSSAQVRMLQARLGGILPLDSHAPEGGYRIRSLYFDDYDNRCFYENEDGTDPREKFRIRIYNSNADRITLECKRKERGKTHKTACPLTVEQTRLLMHGNVRVTLDTNICSSRSVDRFLDEAIPRRPVMPLGQQLLEVKFDEYLPDFIYRSLALNSLSQTAFSKYYLCRKYTR